MTCEKRATPPQALVDEEGTSEEKTLCSVLHTRPLACLPQPEGAMLGELGHVSIKQGPLLSPCDIAS